MNRNDAETLLIHEARLLDNLQLEAWNELFTADGVYWIPLDDTASTQHNAAIVLDTPMRRQERVYHLTQTSYSFPAQSPRSRTLHFISNVALEALPSGQEDGAQWLVQSNQIIYEMRTGDFKQVGIGELHPIVASVEHRLREEQGKPRIVRKKILLINRDAWLGNMTFMM
jgi:3-phenylpropionate/cinnamic acid dioxygenase small subunit